MNIKYLTRHFIFVICFSCGFSDNSKNINKSNFDTLKTSIDTIFNNALLLSSIPDSNFLSSNTFSPTIDSAFIQKVFFQNISMYYFEDSLINEDFSLDGKVEYNFFPTEVYEKNKITLSIVGKIEKEIYDILIVKYYDINSSRYYLMFFDKNREILSSICYYGYNTGNDENIYASEDKKYSSAFLRYNFQENYIKIIIKGVVDINYIFELKDNGKIYLIEKEIIDIE